MLISGDHLLGPRLALLRLRLLARPGGRVPGARSDRVEELDARLCLSGHGRTFTDVQGHIAANRELDRRSGWARWSDVLRADGPITAFDAVPRVYGEAITPMNANWWLSETLCYLRHLRGDRAAPRATGPARALAGLA